MFMYSYCYICSVLCIVSLCCSVYCLCVNVYCTAATCCQPKCSKQIHQHQTAYYWRHIVWDTDTWQQTTQFIRHSRDMNQRDKLFLPCVRRCGQCSPAGMWTAVWCWRMRSEFGRVMLVHLITDSFSLHDSTTDRDSRLTKVTQPLTA